MSTNATKRVRTKNNRDNLYKVSYFNSKFHVYPVFAFFIFILVLFPSNNVKGELIFISWNIKDFGQSRDDNEINAMAKLIKHADILAIQEVVAKHPGGAQAVARLADELNRMGAKWDYRISDPTKSSSSQKSERYAYLWKTSKLTITGGGPRLLSELSSAVEREPYYIQLKYYDVVLNVLNYHACTHTKEFPERFEIRSISAWLLSQKQENVIWAGDMNLVIDDIAFSQILQAGYTNVLNGEKTSLKQECKNGDYLSRGEDNILIKFDDLSHKSTKVLDFIKGKDCSLVSILRDSFSDHFPVEVEVSIIN